MIKKSFISFLLIAFICCKKFAAFAQIQTQTFEQIDSLQNTNKRNVVLFVHTDWCKYCQLMKNTTFKNETIIRILNNEFWFSELNAEQKQDIKFNGQLFKYKPTGSNTGIHELAEQLAGANEKIFYPAIFILNVDYKIIFQYNGYLSSSELLYILKGV